VRTIFIIILGLGGMIIYWSATDAIQAKKARSEREAKNEQ
jgi:hypothetical protein